MTQLSATAFGRATIARILDESAQACQTSPQTNDSSSIRSAIELRRNALQGLTAMHLFDAWLPSDSTPLRVQLRSVVKAASGFLELMTLLRLADDPNVRSHSGIDSVQDRAEHRLRRYAADLSTLRTELSNANGEANQRQWVADLNWKNSESEPALQPFMHESLNRVTRQSNLAELPSDAHFTAVHEWFRAFEELQATQSTFQSQLDANEWQSVSAVVDQICKELAPIIQSSFVKMRCTKWLEKSREADESDALRVLATVAIDNYERKYNEFSTSWNAQASTSLQNRMGLALEFISNPK